MEKQTRTWLCSVVFLDVVDYTKRSVKQQIGIKKRLKSAVDEAVKAVPEPDRIIVDSGDGAALCFLGDPEEALFAALNLRDTFKREIDEAVPPLAVRIGINLGAVKLVENITGQINAVGDGINMANRVMNFAQPNQILASRSFYDVISCLSDDFAQLFRYEGVRQDKHVREHAVYEVLRLREAAISEGSEARKELVGASEGKGVRSAQKDDSPTAVFDWRPDVLETAENDLALHIGPLAKVLVKKTSHKASNIEELYQLLAEYVPTEREKTIFLGKGLVPDKTRPSSTQGSHQAAARGEAVTTFKGDQRPGTVSTWEPEVLRTAEERLAVYVGPVAKVLVRKAAKKTSSTKDLYQVLAKEIPKERDKKHFLNLVTKGDISDRL